MILNYYENKIIKNALLPAEWKSQESLDELLNFLQSNWEQRAIFYDDGKVNSKQQFLDFIGQKNIRTKDYVGTIVYKGHQLNIFPKVFKEFKDDDDRKSLDLQHLMHNLVKWIEYTAKIDYPYISIAADMENTDDLQELFVSLYVRLDMSKPLWIEVYSFAMRKKQKTCQRFEVDLISRIISPRNIRLVSLASFCVHIQHLNLIIC